VEGWRARALADGCRRATARSQGGKGALGPPALRIVTLGTLMTAAWLFVLGVLAVELIGATF
jgi:hypothetical protein